jgi:uncharacterized membrane protein YagU involved in acid resistance
MATAISTPPGLIRTIAIAGLVAGTLDIADALIFYGIRGVPPIRILQGIAYGLIGRVSYTQGTRSVLLGLLLHFIIATTVAAVYILASKHFPHLTRHPLIFGTFYGVAVYIVMNYVVLPLSHVGLRPLPPPAPFINGVAALVVCVGIPIAFFARHYRSQQA